MRLVALDLLRFIAALSVMLFHYFQNADTNILSWLQAVAAYGYLGVPGFFVISGYVISLSATNSSASQFAVSRFVRLFPTYWLAIMFTVSVSMLLSAGQFSAAQILANLTMFNETMGFENIDDVYWTLQEELRFYLCVFALVLLGVFNRYKIWLSAWLVLTLAHLALGQQHLSFFEVIISPYYSSFFIVGIAFYLVQQNGFTFYNTTVLAVATCLSSYHLFHLAVGFMPSNGAISQSISVLSLLGFFALFYLLVSGKIVLKPRKIYLSLGALTYPLYLIHSVAGDAIIERLLAHMSHGMAIIYCSTLMLLISYLITVLFEARISRPLKRKLLSVFSFSDSSKTPGGVRRDAAGADTLIGEKPRAS